MNPVYTSVEYGVVPIYKRQLLVLKQEENHIKRFNEILTKRHVRPTALSPVWHVLGFALGAGTALLGKKAAMACTVAVEEVIDEHYAQQQEKLGENQDPELEKLIAK